MNYLNINCPVCHSNLISDAYNTIKNSYCRVCYFKVIYVNSKLRSISFYINDNDRLIFSFNTKSVFIYSDNPFKRNINIPWFKPDLSDIQSTILKAKTYLLLL